MVRSLEVQAIDVLLDAGHLRQVVSQGPGPGASQLHELVLQRYAGPVHRGLDRRLLADAQPDRRSELAAQMDCLGVVISVDVDDEEAFDVREGPSQGVKRLGEQPTGVRDGPAGVDENHAGAGRERVDVDGPQAVAGQGSGTR
jgi:hypothetical protein